MLKLKRGINEGFWIADNIFVMISAIERNQVLIAIHAPKYINIRRDDTEGFHGATEQLFVTTRRPPFRDQEDDPTGNV